MRLINVHTLRLKEFFDNAIPPYIILSHRWTDDEVSLRDFTRGRNTLSRGYSKIAKFCALVRDSIGSSLDDGWHRAFLYGIDWVWVDTCCIDKTSSAELSEAINSMYRWYENARCCVAFLADVDDVNGLEGSEWFKRGWTLQELLAPELVLFYSKSWVFLGTRDKCMKSIVKATGIQSLYLSDTSTIDVHRSAKLYRVPVAVKMFWASHRQTSRVEDMAYSLLGIFNVNMPLLYGEGRKAFQRLQECIVNNSDDESIFAWTHPRLHRELRVGFFASHPVDFAFSSQVHSMHGQHQPMCLKNRKPYQVTNKGLRFETMLIPISLASTGEEEEFESDFYLETLTVRPNQHWDEWDLDHERCVDCANHSIILANKAASYNLSTRNHQQETKRPTRYLAIPILCTTKRDSNQPALLVVATESNDSTDLHFERRGKLLEISSSSWTAMLSRFGAKTLDELATKIPTREILIRATTDSMLERPQTHEPVMTVEEYKREVIEMRVLEAERRRLRTDKTEAAWLEQSRLNSPHAPLDGVRDLCVTEDVDGRQAAHRNHVSYRSRSEISYGGELKKMRKQGVRRDVIEGNGSELNNRSSWRAVEGIGRKRPTPIVAAERTDE